MLVIITPPLIPNSIVIWVTNGFQLRERIIKMDNAQTT